MLSANPFGQAEYAHDPALSEDGRYVVFDGSIAGVQGIWRRETRAGATFEEVAGGDATLPSVSADGRFVSFTTNEGASLPAITDGSPVATPAIEAPGVYVRDMAIPPSEPGAFTLASAKDHSTQSLTYEFPGADEEEAEADRVQYGALAAGRSAITADGRTVAFVTTAQSDLAGAGTPAMQVAVRHLDTDETTLVSVRFDPATGRPAIDAETGEPEPVPEEEGQWGAVWFNGKAATFSVPGASVTAAVQAGGTARRFDQRRRQRGRLVRRADLRTGAHAQRRTPGQTVRGAPLAPDRDGRRRTDKARHRWLGPGKHWLPCEPGGPAAPVPAARRRLPGPLRRSAHRRGDPERRQRSRLRAAFERRRGLRRVPGRGAAGERRGSVRAQRIQHRRLPREHDRSRPDERAAAADPVRQRRRRARSDEREHPRPRHLPRRGADRIHHEANGVPARSTRFREHPGGRPRPASNCTTPTWATETLTRVTGGYEGGLPGHPEIESGNEDRYTRPADGALSPSIDASGTLLAFSSTASNLVFGDGNSPPNAQINRVDGADVFLVPRIVFDDEPTPQQISPAPANPRPEAPWRLEVSAASLASGAVQLKARVPAAGVLGGERCQHAPR